MILKIKRLYGYKLLLIWILIDLLLRSCKELNHVPLTCDEANLKKAYHYLEEKMTKALIHTCYKCNRPFFKEEGCNKMTCICGAVMCYICDQPVNNYEHFRGQGSTRTDL